MNIEERCVFYMTRCFRKVMISKICKNLEFPKSRRIIIVVFVPAVAIGRKRIGLFTVHINVDALSFDDRRDSQSIEQFQRQKQRCHHGNRPEHDRQRSDHVPNELLNEIRICNILRPTIFELYVYPYYSDIMYDRDSIISFLG